MYPSVTVPGSPDGHCIRSRGIHHVALRVTHLDEALAFYTGVLGAIVLDRPATLPNRGAWLAVGAHQVHLVDSPHPPERSFQHVALEVDDLVAADRLLRTHGVTPSEHLIVDGYGLQAFVFDPSGNRIELYQPLWPLPADLRDAFERLHRDAR